MWLRASGASQLMTTYDLYTEEAKSAGGQEKLTSYFKTLSQSPLPPHPSLKTIIADHTRACFDLRVTKRRSKIDWSESYLT